MSINMCKYIKIIWEISRVIIDLYSKVTYFIAWEIFIVFYSALLH
jgi:hypothetical protein